jgi:tRNA U34 5-carboxymethylaminomethyl modifying enzyme MnmG/GidA
MAENKKSFVLYCDLIHTIEKLPDDKAGLLFKHLFRYVNDQNPITDDLIVEIAFEPIKHQLKRDLSKWDNKIDKLTEQGRLGGIKSGEARALKKKQKEANASKNEANEAVTVNVTVNDNVNDIFFIKKNLTEQMLDDLENSTHIELVCKRTELSLDKIKLKIPEFKKIANIEYPKPMDLVMHFIRWVNQNKKIIDKSSLSPEDREEFMRNAGKM